MGLPLLISLLLTIAGVMFWIISKYSRKRNREFFDSLTGLALGMGIVMWILAVAVKDPITDFISRDAQLIITGLTFAGIIWKYYFDPMKKRIIKLEIGQGEIKSDISNIKSDLHIIKAKLIDE